MLGAIVGDIVGSRFECSCGKTSKDFALFEKTCQFTDDTVLTLAVCKSLVECRKCPEKLSETTAHNLRAMATQYYRCSYGNRFIQWVYNEDQGPLNSCGNGAAMRVSGCAYAAQSLEDVKILSKAVTAVTHTHPEGIKGAEATAAATFMALNGSSKKDIAHMIKSQYYDLGFTLEDVKRNPGNKQICQTSVPQALKCFTESTSFEDAIRNAVNLGADTDTQAAIAGSVAGAYYGVPEEIALQARDFLDENLCGILDCFEKEFCCRL